MSKFPSINIPVITIIIILLGLFNLNNYYQRYGIEVYNYIEVQEILFSFTNIFPVFMFLMIYLLMSIAQVIDEEGAPTQTNLIVNHKSDSEREMEERRFVRITNIIAGVIVVGSAIRIIYVYCKWWNI